MHDESVRFSDQMLFQMRNDITQKIEEDRESRENITKELHAINEKVDTLGLKQQELEENTAVWVQLGKDVGGTMRLGKSFQNFLVWLLKWGSIGYGLYSALSSFTELIEKHF